MWKPTSGSRAVLPIPPQTLSPTVSAAACQKFMNPRKGLHRIGMRTWEVRGETVCVWIEREGPRAFTVRPSRVPAAFTIEKFNRLGKARAFAEFTAGLRASWPKELDRPPRHRRLKRSETTAAVPVENSCEPTLPGIVVR